jgi:hypothetical protein
LLLYTAIPKSDIGFISVHAAQLSMSKNASVFIPGKVIRVQFPSRLMSRRTIVASVSKKNPGDEHRDFWVDELANQMKSGSLRFRQRRHSRLCQPSLANFSPHDMHLRSVGRSWAARWSMTSSSASDELEFDSLI